MSNELPDEYELTEIDPADHARIHPSLQRALESSRGERDVPTWLRRVVLGLRINFWGVATLIALPALMTAPPLDALAFIAMLLLRSVGIALCCFVPRGAGQVPIFTSAFAMLIVLTGTVAMNVDEASYGYLQTMLILIDVLGTIFYFWFMDSLARERAGSGVQRSTRGLLYGVGVMAALIVAFLIVLPIDYCGDWVILVAVIASFIILLIRYAHALAELGQDLKDA